jgi:hypothetical protein
VWDNITNIFNEVCIVSLDSDSVHCIMKRFWRANYRVIIERQWKYNCKGEIRLNVVSETNLTLNYTLANGSDIQQEASAAVLWPEDPPSKAERRRAEAEGPHQIFQEDGWRARSLPW